MRNAVAFQSRKITRLRSRRVSFVPTQLSGCVLWLRSDLGITLNGSTVSAWGDQSGNANNMLQGTGANQPAYVSNVVNGRPVLRFDGATSVMAATGVASLWPQKLTIFAIVNTTSLGAAAHEGQIVGIDVVHYALTHYQGDGRVYGYLGGSGNNVAGFEPTATWMMPGLYWDGTTSANSLRNYNGSTIKQQLASVQSSYVAAGNLSIGGAGTGFWNGDMAEIVMVNRALTLSEIGRLVAYVNQRYGLSL